MSNKAHKIWGVPHLRKGYGYPIIRNGKNYWVDDRSGKVIPHPSGGATANTPNSQAQQATSVLNEFLSVASRKYYSILGSVATGSAGGSTANVTWQQQIPIVPAFCTAIEYEITMPVTLTQTAGNVTTQSATLSPFAPYSAIANQFVLGGAPPWPLTEVTPWHIDQTQHKINYDPFYPGLGNDSGIFGTNSLLDQGPLVQVIGGSGSLAPGATVTNTTSGTVNTNYSFTFKFRIQLQRKRHLLWGAVPFGDPENRPNNITQIYPLVGTLPEQSLFVNATSGSSCVLNGAATINAVYELAYIDLLPPGMQTPPAPAVGYGMQLTVSSTTGLAAGTISPITHRTAQIYTAIHHLLINGQLPIQADYFGLWDDQDQQSAKYSYDATSNTFNQYFTKYQRVYRRYPYKGYYGALFDDGEFPEIPSVTPANQLMSPDQSYAQAFGIPVTPAMTTAIRIPSATSLSSPYVRNYEVGLVRVPY